MTVNALQSMAPVDSPSTVESSGWSGFWQDTLKGVVGYVIAKDAQSNNVQPPQVVYQQGPGVATSGRSSQSGGLGTLLLIGGVVWAVASAGGK